VSTLVVLFNWDSWFQRFRKAIIKLQSEKAKSNEHYDERHGGEEIRDMGTSPWALQWIFFPWRRRKAGLHERWDLEKALSPSDSLYLLGEMDSSSKCE
jgi:hypothetical protein